MRLLILNGPRAAGANQKYRGTYRKHPSYREISGAEDEINRLFFWFVEAGGELGVVGDLQKAVRYAELLNKDAKRGSSTGNFEVVEATDGSFEPKGSGQFLGFDLSSGYNNSLLWSGLTSYISDSTDPTWDLMRPRWTDFRQLYFPKLNEYGLFERKEDAMSCFLEALSIQNDFPNFFEGGNLNEFAPTGIYQVK